jgi:hypothetical protein
MGVTIGSAQFLPTFNPVTVGTARIGHLEGIRITGSGVQKARFSQRRGRGGSR